MTALAYVLSSLVWSVGGFAFGFAVGRGLRSLDSINRKTPMPDNNEPDSERPHRTRKPRTEQLFGVVLVVLAVLSVVGVGLQTWRLNEATTCQAAFNDAYTEALRKRTSAAATERNAQRELLLTMLNQPTPDKARDALQTYLDSLARADQVRTDAQIPTRKCL